MKSLATTAGFVAFAALAGGMLPRPVAAAPFCIQNQGIAPLCIYYDALDCGREAQRQGAACANPAELRLTPRSRPYCVVTSGQVSLCNLGDRTSCARSAVLQRGTWSTRRKLLLYPPRPLFGDQRKLKHGRAGRDHAVRQGDRPSSAGIGGLGMVWIEWKVMPTRLGRDVFPVGGSGSGSRRPIRAITRRRKRGALI